jgi:hypothetical protein
MFKRLFGHGDQQFHALKTIYRTLGSLVLFLIMVAGCNKDDSESFPYVPVNLTLGYNEISSIGVGGVATITSDPNDEYGAYIDYLSPKTKKLKINQRVYGNGLLIYRAEFDYYIAYDLTCTYHARQDYCAVDVATGLTLPMCPCCKSIFMIEADAVPSSGSKAKFPLKHYNTTFLSNQNSLIISSQ